VRLAVLSVPDPDAARDFYQFQFDLALLGRSADSSIRLSDGTITILLTKEQTRNKRGIQCFGIETANLAALKESLHVAGVATSESSLGQLQFKDPEGNLVIASERGWAN
jgi:hypothetical protein